MLVEVLIKGVHKKTNLSAYFHSQLLFFGNRVQKKTIFQKLKKTGSLSFSELGLEQNRKIGFSAHPIIFYRDLRV